MVKWNKHKAQAETMEEKLWQTEFQPTKLVTDGYKYIIM